MKSNKISIQEAENLVLNYLDKKMPNNFIPAIQSNSTIMFEWGIVIYWNDKRFVEDKISKHSQIGVSPFLVDRIDKSLHELNYLELLDKQLEEYRLTKGYSHAIKFPVIRTEFKNGLDKIFSLFETKEIFQIKEGLKLLKEEYPQFEVSNLVTFLKGKPVTTIEYDIACFFKRDSIILYQSEIKNIPKEILVLKDYLKKLEIILTQIKIVPEFILELKELEFLSIEDNKLIEIPFDLRNLVNLKEVRLLNTGLSQNEIKQLKLVKNCKLEIE